MNQLISTAAPTAAILAIILFSLPSYIGLFKQKGAAKGIAIILILSLTLLALLGLAVQFNYPFGAFTFGDTLGYKIINLVPWTIAFAYTPLVLASFWLASKVTKSGLRILIAGLFLPVFNLVLDPALAFMGVRSWENGGPLFGVPIINFGGWLIVGLITSWILHLIWGAEDAVKRSIAYSGFIVIWFWGGVNLGLEQWVPGGLGIFIGILILVLMSAEKRRQAKTDTK